MKTEYPLKWKIEKRKVADLIPLEKNPRKITKGSMEKLKDRITKRGMHDVLKLDSKGVVLSGNMRMEALKQLKIAEVDVMELDPKFCDVIINRYESLTGDKARKL